MNEQYKNALKTALPVIIIYLIVIAAAGINLSAWGDEKHFADVVRMFGNDLSFARMADYPEVTPPLVYVLYAVWGKLFGFSLPALRSLTLIFAFTGYLAAHRIFFEQLKSALPALLALVFVLVNPYAAGLSLFVFTDMQAFTFLMLGMLAYTKKKPAAYALFISAALLCRQYSAFFPAAVGLISIVDYFQARNSAKLKWLVSSAAAFIPLFGFMVVWKGIAPPAGMNLWVMENEPLWHPTAVTTYLVMMVIYSFPFLVWRRRICRLNRKEYSAIFFFSMLYFVFPVSVSRVSGELNNTDTVGYFHKLVKMIMPSVAAERIFFWLVFFVSLILVYRLGRELFRAFKFKECNNNTVFILAIFVFLLMMPFSYQVWEKYLLPLIPMAAVSILEYGKK